MVTLIELMGSEFDIIAWYKLLVFLISGFIPAWILFLLLSAIIPRFDFVLLLRVHYPKALPISNFFFCLIQVAGTLIRPSYPGNIFTEIRGNIFFLFISITIISLLLLLFIRPGKWFNKFVLIAGCFLTGLFIAERVSIAGDLSAFFPIWVKSILWFLFLGFLIALSEFIKNRFQKNDRGKTPVIK